MADLQVKSEATLVKKFGILRTFLLRQVLDSPTILRNSHTFFS